LMGLDRIAADYVSDTWCPRPITKK
jgi:hypothetical protein